IVVTLIDDTVLESSVPETFLVELSNATGGAVIGTPSAAIVRIVDNEGGFDLALSTNETIFQVVDDATYRAVFRIVATNLYADLSPERVVPIDFPEDLLDYVSAESLLSSNGAVAGSYDSAVDRWTVPPLFFNQSVELRPNTTH